MISSSRIAGTLARTVALFSVAAVATAGLLGCSAPGSTPPPSNGGGSGSGSGGTDTSDGGPVAIPFVVSDQFFPSGFMGDSPTDFNAITMTSDSAQCPARAPGAQGACYAMTWTPTFVMGATSAWVGVYWQYPSNNWGALPGKPISPGATKVTFSAQGAKGGEQVEFLAGGVNVAGSNPSLTNADTFSASTKVTLTTSWAPYEIPLTGDAYSTVIGAFAWTITTSATDPITFYVDDIAWE
jgi:hypothetical protein